MGPALYKATCPFSDLASRRPQEVKFKVAAEACHGIGSARRASSTSVRLRPNAGDVSYQMAAMNCSVGRSL